MLHIDFSQLIKESLSLQILQVMNNIQEIWQRVHSTADVAIILIDARQGILTQTKRHSYIASLLGIKNLIVAINKMDLVDFSAR